MTIIGSCPHVETRANGEYRRCMGVFGHDGYHDCERYEWRTGSGPVNRHKAETRAGIMAEYAIVRENNQDTQADDFVDSRPGRYYVTVRDGNRHGYMLGPYETHAAALAQVQRGSELAAGVDGKAHWYAFGTGRLRDTEETVKSVFGV